MFHVLDTNSTLVVNFICENRTLPEYHVHHVERHTLIEMCKRLSLIYILSIVSHHETVQANFSRFSVS